MPHAFQWRSNARPHIQRNHIDGPLLVMRDGSLHWLTLMERFALCLGRTNAHELEAKLRPDLAAYDAAMMAEAR